MVVRVEIDRRVSQLNVRQVCRAAEKGEWGVPEFQREFTWPAARVAGLADTLVAGHSMGVWHLWRPARRVEVRNRHEIVDTEPESWILDGQQRLTAVCLLHNTKPVWFSDDEWAELQDTIPVAIDLGALRRGDTKIVLRAAGAAESASFLPFAALFADAPTLQSALGERGAADLYVAAREVTSKVNEYLVPVITLADTPQAVVIEQFRRLNTGQTRVPSAIIRQGLLSVQVPGFTVDRSEPLRAILAETGWPVRSAVVFDAFVTLTDTKSIAAVDRATVDGLWDAYVESWQKTLGYLARRGIRELSLWPAERLLATLVVAAHRWPAAIRDDRLIQWALCALWDGHQQRGGALMRDQALLNTAWRNQTNWTAAIDTLTAALSPHTQPVRAGDLTDMRTNPAATSGRRERVLYAYTHPNPPTIGPADGWTTWIPLANRTAGGLADFVLALTVDGETFPAEQLTTRQLAAQAATLPHTTRRRAETLTTTLNATLEQLATIRPTRTRK